MPKHQCLWAWFGFAFGWLGFFTILFGCAVAARRRLSLGAARSGKRRAGPGDGGGRRGGREGSGRREVRAGRAGRAPRDAGLPAQMGGAGRLPRHPTPGAGGDLPWPGRPRSCSSSRERALPQEPAIPAVGAVLTSGTLSFTGGLRLIC